MRFEGSVSFKHWEMEEGWHSRRKQREQHHKARGRVRACPQDVIPSSWSHTVGDVGREEDTIGKPGQNQILEA